MAAIDRALRPSSVQNFVWDRMRMPSGESILCMVYEHSSGHWHLGISPNTKNSMIFWRQSTLKLVEMAAMCSLC